MFSAPIKGILLTRCYASLHCKGYGYTRTWNVHNAGKTLYIGIEVV